MLLSIVWIEYKQPCQENSHKGEEKHRDSFLGNSEKGYQDHHNVQKFKKEYWEMHQYGIAK